MLSLVILFTGTAITTLVNEANCAPDRALDNILSLLLQQQQQKIRQQNKLKAEEIPHVQSSSNDESEDDTSHYGSLKKQKVLELIQLAQQKDPDTRDENYSIEHLGFNIEKNVKKINSNRLNRGVENENDSDNLINQIVSQLLSKTVQSSSPKILHNKARLDLPSNIETIGGKGQDVANLNDYSKIYIVLNPQAVKKSKNKNAVNDLISEVLSLSSYSSQKQRIDSNKQKYYKGFPVKENLYARRSRDSSEVYVTKGSMEESYKPKRSRNDHGGGNGGRTAIPYIRHRGDIYEKDH